MTIHPPKVQEPLRLWPGILVAVLVLLARFVAPILHPDGAMVGVLGGVVGLLAVVTWWLFFSRAPWPDRLGAIAVIALGLAATFPLLHESIATGMMGMMFFIYAVPVSLTLAFVAWAVAARRLPDGSRRATMVATILLACAAWTLARTDGLIGGASQLAWRWTPTAEERLLALEPQPPPPAIANQPTAAAEPHQAPPAAATDARLSPSPSAPGRPAVRPALSPPENPRAEDREARVAPAGWPGFRGPERDGIVRGVRIETEWPRKPPVELWRRAIGPGWSSFAVHGDVVYTQEQRGDDEVVAAYRLGTGEPVWRHRDPVRFWESNGGAGPRATPAVGNGRVYALGATGIVNALDAASGAVIWSRSAAADTGAEIPGWGFAGSPLVIGDVVVVAASGRLVAYDATTGSTRWFGPKEGGGGYSSPHAVTLDSVTQILLLRGGRATSVSPADGAVLWEHEWLPGVSIVQPAVASGGDLLITAGDMMGGVGVRRLAVARGVDGWTVEERWTSRGLKPYFNDFVVHEGHAYGFDGSILSCIDLEDGTRKWKGGRYGQGQFLLLPDADVLLVLSEEGELALVKAAPDKHTELARMPALEGKTWNHPVVIGDVLLVRNGQEMAVFRLPIAGR
ncbi:MAG: PQQ-binding-like beta-propeller repeat protein [Acidobacteria bacterium]|nr:PQQ-binding-like beta-propeller repeat protein [Acidobacteriota bacterium]